MDLSNFNVSTVDITNRFEALPAGDYVVMITASQEKPTKAGTGKYLELTLEIQSGPMQGRKLWDRLNLVNQNSKAVEIAQRNLAQICHAVGVMAPKKSDDLHYKPLVVVLKVKSDENGMSNEVKGYKQINGAGYQAADAAPAAPRAPNAPAKPAMPWATARA